MKTKRIVLSGGPSSGKTTLINELERLGKHCFHEVSRDLIREAQKKGIAQPFLTQPEAFNTAILQSRLVQFKEADQVTEPYSFYDRGMLDVVAYMEYANQPIPESFLLECKAAIYDEVFLLPPWSEIHIQDKERYETFEQAKTVFEHIKNTYLSYGYAIIEVPFGTVTDRVLFILNHCK
ncbi:AAA family ATPase [Aquimarina agarilytica]|uniref:AAA family ATPase n=1 Tax=Aquimarina agarilytica TaxID=1087449 RepID=UPI000288588C|nr:ATP-binding protein [Aquimarina agarilytica]